MQEAGHSIEGPVDSFTVPVEARTPASLQGRFDHTLLAVKSQHTPAALEALKPHLSEDGYVVSVQNGLNEADIAAVVGAERTIGCFINFGADYEGPGRILYDGRGAFVLGEIDGSMTARLDDLHKVIRDFEPDANVTENVFGYLWAKLAFAAVLQAQTVSNEPTEEFLDNDTARMKAVIDGYADARRGSKKLYSGIWRDIVVRKRRTEVALQGGPVLRTADQHGIDVTTYAASLQMIRDAEDGRRDLGGEMADELLAIAQAAASVEA